MNIYIDFDDVICETAKSFCQIADRLFGIKKPYNEVHFFNLQQSFGLTDNQYDALMKEGHLPEILLSYEETDGASISINKIVDAGHDVKIITGRPFDSYEPSRQWLDNHNLSRLPLYCVDKYGREIFNQNSTFNMTLNDLYAMSFDLAIEDSPAAFKHLEHFGNCKVAVFDRPWNKDAILPSDNYIRVKNWDQIVSLL
ncbi:MAG: 2-dehydropantoate 2-reductase [Lachnospiraceae bacterium]|nr:2-dehydropantoate 2-reductase [Lachnospiraceae bacterium]